MVNTSIIGGHGPSAQGGPAFLARGGQGWVALSDRVRGVPCRPGQGFQLWRFCAKVAILRASGDFVRKWRFCTQVAILRESGNFVQKWRFRRAQRHQNFMAIHIHHPKSGDFEKLWQFASSLVVATIVCLFFFGPPHDVVVGSLVWPGFLKRCLLKEA